MSGTEAAPTDRHRRPAAGVSLRRRCLGACCAGLLWALPLALQAKLEVEIRGISGRLLENVEQRLSIRLAAERGDPAEATVQALHAKAPDDIATALQPFGYYSPEIESDLSGAGSDWRAVYRVRSGPRTQIARVDLRIDNEGAGQAELQAPAAALQALPGQALLHEPYETKKAALSARAYALGYLDVRYTRSELRVYPGRQQAEIELSLDTGPRYHFGPLRFEVDGLDPEFLRRYITIRPGAPFDPQALLDSQFALVDLDYFESVELDPQRDERSAEGNRLPIVVRGRLRPPRRYDFGVGYGTDTGARVSAAAEFRHLNDHGHKLRGELRLSEIKNNLGAEYRIPLGRKAAEQLSFSAASTSERLEDGESLKYTLGTALTRVPGDWQRRIYLNFEHEESELGSARQTSDLLIPGLQLTREQLDNRIHTRRGWAVFGDLHGAHKALIGTTSFLQARVIGRGALPLGARGRLLGRAEYGASLVEEFSELPASQRFFAGGDQSVRGYKYQSLGPVDADGKLIGGRYLNAYSLEFEHPVWRQWGAAVFYDLGGASDEPGPRLSAGVGAGLRYRAPIGYAQLDLAHPLDGNGVRLHIGVRVGL